MFSENFFNIFPISTLFFIIILVLKISANLVFKKSFSNFLKIFNLSYNFI